MNRTTRSRTAFTLIELMVVIAIIALLVAVLLPAFNTVRTKARNAQAQSQFQALAAGINMFRSEDALGGAYPPSASDNPDDRRVIANPQHFRGGNDGETEVKVTGAHLLFHALVGADGLGPPGFRDINRNGEWWDDTHDDDDPDPTERGAYALDPATGQERSTRYGSGGYVDDKVKDTARSLRQLDEKGAILNLDDAPADVARDELLFLDPWGTPILYYRARRASQRIVADTGATGGAAAGIYRQEDNGIITGTNAGTYRADGFDFGPGKENGRYHAISTVPDLPALTAPNPVQAILTNATYDDSFVRFILDSSVKARPTPARKTEYLLISGGPDQIYGTDDDVRNWTSRVD